MRKAPLADRLRVRSPCSSTIRWDEMPGTERIRFCASCDLDVHDTSRFTRDEVEALFRKRREGDRLCIRLHVRESDGAVLLADGAVLPSKSLTKKRSMATAALTMAAAAAGAASLAGCASPPQPTAPSVEVEIPAQPAAPETGVAVVAASPPPVAAPPSTQEPPPAQAPFPVTTPPLTTASKTAAKKIIPPRATPHPQPAKKSGKRVVIIDGDAW